MLVLVFSASTSRLLMTPDVTFESLRVSTSSWLSRMLPSTLNRSFNIWFSMSFSWVLSAFILKIVDIFQYVLVNSTFPSTHVKISSFLCFSRSGLSNLTTSDKTWSSRPSLVTVKLMIVTWTFFKINNYQVSLFCLNPTLTFMQTSGM